MSTTMKILAAVGTIAALGALAQPAMADGRFSIGVGYSSGGGYHRPHYVAPPIYPNHTWVAPAVNYYPTDGYYGGGVYNPPISHVYYASPVVYAPQVYYAQPVYYAPPTYYYQPGGVVYGNVPRFYQPGPRVTFGMVGRW